MRAKLDWACAARASSGRDRRGREVTDARGSEMALSLTASVRAGVGGGESSDPEGVESVEDSAGSEQQEAASGSTGSETLASFGSIALRNAPFVPPPGSERSSVELERFTASTSSSLFPTTSSLSDCPYGLEPVLLRCAILSPRHQHLLYTPSELV